MRIFEEMDFYGHKQIVFARDEETGLKTIIAVHDTTLGPALGGTRIWNYATEEEALYDVLRLSRGMTLKNAGAGLVLGGGKAVIIGDAKKIKSRELFHAYGRIVDSLNGTYITAEDVNMSTQDIDYVSEVTPHVSGTSQNGENPSPFTSRGVLRGIQAGAKMRYGNDSLDGRTVAVQGLGNVGYHLCELLKEQGATLLVSDIDTSRVERAADELGATPVDKDSILFTKCDILSPCALGAVFTAENAPKLQCDIISGSANNVLLDPAAGDAIESRGILYCPDYIVNAGGVINCEAEVKREYNVDAINKKIDDIYNTTIKIIELSRERNIPTYAAADEYAYGIIKAAKKAAQ